MNTFEIIQQHQSLVHNQFSAENIIALHDTVKCHFTTPLRKRANGTVPMNRVVAAALLASNGPGIFSMVSTRVFDNLCTTLDSMMLDINNRQLVPPHQITLTSTIHSTRPFIM